MISLFTHLAIYYYYCTIRKFYKKGLYMRKTLLSLAVVSLLGADTTMCFKKDWIDPSTIETTTLDGGKCSSVKSLMDMKADGWLVEDIKISTGKSGMNFMYVLKKGSINLTDINLEAKLNEIQDKREANKKVELIKVTKQNGEKIYKRTCVKCHGSDGEIEAYNTSRALNTMSVDDIKVAMANYEFGDKDNGRAVLMQPYATILSKEELKAVISYIQTLK